MPCASVACVCTLTCPTWTFVSVWLLLEFEMAFEVTELTGFAAACVSESFATLTVSAV
ncbi:hypothetical protein D3C78_1874450 [compost metagenome]